MILAFYYTALEFGTNTHSTIQFPQFTGELLFFSFFLREGAVKEVREVMRTAWGCLLALAPATAFTAVAGPATVSGRAAAVRGWGGATFADFSDPRLANLGSAGPCKWQRNVRTRPALRMSGGGASGPSLMSSLALSRNKMLAFLQAQFLPVGLLLAVFVGVCFPQPGAAFGKIAVTKYAASGIFLIGGLKLRTAEAVEALRDVKSIVFGVFSILFLTVVVGARLARAMPLSVPEFITGLTLFMCMPCTISSGAALAAQAGGNIALGLILTVICSTLGRSASCHASALSVRVHVSMLTHRNRCIHCARHA